MSQTNSQSTQAEECGVSKISAVDKALKEATKTEVTYEWFYYYDEYSHACVANPAKIRFNNNSENNGKHIKVTIIREVVDEIEEDF